MREIDVRAVATPVEQARRLRPIERIPADVRHLRAAAPRDPRAPAGDRPSPGTSGASSLPSYSHCMPRQIPSRGAPASTRRRIAQHASARQARRSPRSVRRRGRRWRCGIEIVRRAGIVEIGTDRGEPLADRREIPGAVIDQRNRYSRPLRRGQHLRELPVLRAREPQRARERLEHRLDLVMARAAVQHLDVDVRARALREPVEEIVHQLGLQVADRDRRAARDRRPRARGRRGRLRRRRASRPSA